jgi:hypothetical protein
MGPPLLLLLQGAVTAETRAPAELVMVLHQ